MSGSARDPIQIAKAFYGNVPRDLPEPRKRLRSVPGAEITYTDEADATCPGGQQITECTTAVQVVQDTLAAAEQSSRPNNEGDFWTTYIWAGSTACGACNRTCEGAAHTRGGEPTGLVRLAFIQPDPSMPVIKLDLTSATNDVVLSSGTLPPELPKSDS